MAREEGAMVDPGGQGRRVRLDRTILWAMNGMKIRSGGGQQIRGAEARALGSWSRTGLSAGQRVVSPLFYNFKTSFGSALYSTNH